MISLDTNVLLYSLNADCAEFATARDLVASLHTSSEVVICELVLVELYLLLRNPAVISAPLPAPHATSVCQAFRAHPKWRLVESAPVMGAVWKRAGAPGFARRRIVDARLALTLRHHGVTEIITRNVRDFEGFGFERLTNPFA